MMPTTLQNISLLTTIKKSVQIISLRASNLPPCTPILDIWLLHHMCEGMFFPGRVQTVINGYNSYTCSDSDIVSVQPQNFPLRYFPVRTNGHTQFVRPQNQSISIDKNQSHSFTKLIFLTLH